MKGTVGKGVKRWGKVQSKRSIQRGKGLKSPKIKCENGMKMAKMMGKTDSKSAKVLKSLKAKMKVKKNMKFRISTITDQKNNENTEISMSPGVLEKTLDSKELEIAEGKETKPSIKKKISKLSSPNVLLKKPRLKIRTVDNIKKEIHTKAKKKSKHVRSQLGKRIPIVKNETSGSQAKRKEKREMEDEKPITLIAGNNGSEVSAEKVSEAVQVLLQLLKDRKPTLFSDEGKYIYLYIKCLRIPITPCREVRIVLPHSLLPEKPEVCLFSSDLKKGKRVDHEPTLEYVKNILAEHGITEITEVITLRQLKTEYDQFEMKRALCSRFDFFLSDAKVSGHILHYLGKTFYTRKKVPVPIKMESNNLKKLVQTALHKTSFRLFNSIMLNLKVAHSNMTPKQIEENIIAASAALHEFLPGGWNNVACLAIQGVKTLPVPIYVSTIKENDVPEIRIEAKRPKAAKDVVGELPGIGLVRVTADGNVEVIKRERYNRKREFTGKDEEDNHPPKRGRSLQLKNKKESDESDGEADRSGENDDEEEKEEEEDDDDDVSEVEDYEENEIESDGNDNEVDGDKDNNGTDADSSDVNENESSEDDDSGLLSMESSYLKELKKKFTHQKPHKKKSNAKR